jgi:hypothetical protein
MARPDDEEVEKTKAETAAALGLVVNSKIAAAQPKTLPQQPGAPTYIKYTPTQQGPQYNSGASQRIIKMQVREFRLLLSQFLIRVIDAMLSGSKCSCSSLRVPSRSRADQSVLLKAGTVASPPVAATAAGGEAVGPALGGTACVMLQQNCCI